MPYALRLHGSILPKMLVALAIMAVWSVIVTVISKTVFDCERSASIELISGLMICFASGHLSPTSNCAGFLGRSVVVVP